MEKFAKGGIVKDGLFIEHDNTCKETIFPLADNKFHRGLCESLAKALQEFKRSITVYINGKESI